MVKAELVLPESQSFSLTNEAIVPSTTISANGVTAATASVVYSDMNGATTYSSVTGGEAGYDDYYANTGDPFISLSQFSFIGGVAAAGGTLTFEFCTYPSATLVAYTSQTFNTATNPQNPTTWTITFTSPITIPNNGVLEIWSQSGTTGMCYAGATGPTVGTHPHSSSVPGCCRAGLGYNRLE